MHKRKKLVVVVTVGVILSLGIVGLYSIKQNKGEVLEPKEKGNMIAMYLEDNTGEYKLSTSKEFPKEGYVLNLEKSSCTNGGILSQDDETKSISLKTNDKTECNLYFSVEKCPKSSLYATTTLANGLKVYDESATTYNECNSSEMYTFTHLATEQTEALTDFRYIGANPNNWIRFNDEDWRIIGVFTVEAEMAVKEMPIL